jgi:SsrA-binding protein
MSEKKKDSSKTIAVNRKARHGYSIEEEIEAGIVLVGTEVKSLRDGRASINEAYAAEKEGAIWLINAMISEFAGGNQFNHEPRRPRKLLLHQKQMKKLIGRIKVKGVTLVPLRLYFNSRGFAKVMLGVAVGRKEYEKRDVIKKRDWQRDKDRIMRAKK